MLFNSFKEQWLESLLGELWQRWSALGVAGYSSERKSHVIEDPERLLIATLYLARWDARLFDEVMSWVLANTVSINVKRLTALLGDFPDESVRLISAVATKAQHGDARWKKLIKLSSESEPLFYLDAIRRLPVGDVVDTEFAAAGLVRGVFKDRKLSETFSAHEGGSLVLKLRALLGMNAHAEVLAYLSDGRKAHASMVARDLCYSQRAVQEILTQMEKGGGVSVTIEGRKKLFRLTHACWSSLVPETLSWNDEHHRLAFLSHAWKGAHDLDSDLQQPMLIASKLRKLTISLDEQFPQFRNSQLESHKGEAYLGEWTAWISSHINL